MALLPVLGLVKEYLPFLNDGTQDAKIESRITQVQYFLQKYFKIADADIEDQTKYTGLQNILVAKVSAYELLNTKSVELAAGNATTGTTPETTFLKKAQADVVEAEFDQFDIKKSATLAKSSAQLMSDLLTEICSISQTLGVSLPYCQQIVWDTYQPFIILQ